MKFANLKLFFSLGFSFVSQIAYSQSTTVDFGSNFSGSTASLFTNEAKTPFSSANDGLIAFGFFNDGYNVATEAAAMNQSNFSTFLSNFNVLGEKDFSSVTVNSGGYINSASTFADTAGATGKDGYIITLAGVNSWINASTASEIGLFRDTSEFTTIPPGALPLPGPYDIKSVSYDTVLLGAEHLGETSLPSDFTGLTGNLYSTGAISAVPEPSTYAMMLGILSFGFVYYKKRMKGKQPSAEEITETV
jgi:hypothetical protein